MLEIKVIELENMQDLQNILKKHRILVKDIEQYISNGMIIYDNNVPIGAAGFILKENTAFIQFMAAAHMQQNHYIGDGLIKALLNLADRKGVKKVFVISDEQSGIYKKIGFKYITYECFEKFMKTFHLERRFNNEVILAVDLPDFFQHACTSNKMI